MRRLATAILAVAAVLAIAHVLARLPHAPPALSPALSDRLARLDSELLLTYAASPTATLPSELRGVPREVEELLRAIEAAGAGRVSVQIVDPTEDAGVAGYLGAVGLAPFRARALEVDVAVEREVWSALRIAYGPHGSAVIRAVTPAVLPDLQALIASHLELLERPRPPRIALAAPLDFNHLRRELRTRGELLECDFEIDARIPEEADLLLWIDPVARDESHVDALRALLRRGGSVVIAGRLPPELPRAFGLASVHAGLGSLARSKGQDQDFRPLAGARSGPNGTLLFTDPTTLVPASGRLRELGFDLFPLASSSRTSLLVLLAPDARADPRRGSLVFSASSSPFSDAYLRHEAFAHRELLSVLVSSLGGEERLAISGAALTRPAGIPELAPSRKSLLSFAVVLAAPLGLLLAALSRGRRPSSPVIRLRPDALLAASAAVSALLLARFAPAGASVDLTRAGVNELAPGSRSIAAAISTPVRIELHFSPDAELPPPWRASVREARALARRFTEAGSRIAVVDSVPDASDPDQLAALAREGVLPLDAPRSSFAAIRIVGASASQVLDFRELAGFEHLEFRLAAALARLAQGRSAPRVGFLAFAPKLTPAEALEYQQRGLLPPGGGDRFGEARALLEANDFFVTELDPARPETPPGTDVLVCLEPRRDAGPAIGAVAKHLSSGGNVLLAAQHFGLRPRAAGPEPSVHPEPWFSDVDRLYFPSIGIELVRELLFDEQHGTSGPLAVRATPSGFGQSSPITRGLSELLLESPNRIRVDGAKLAAFGLTAREVITTSERTWSHDWKGGPLPEAVLRGPPGSYLGPQPLAVLFDGSFPPASATPELSATSGGGPSARLLLIGSSQVFSDTSLRASAGDAAHLLLNSVAALALPADEAAILAHRAATPALGNIEPAEKIAWRVAIVASTPALLLLLGLVRARRRPRREAA